MSWLLLSPRVCAKGVVVSVWQCLCSAQVADLVADTRLRLAQVFPKESLRQLLHAVSRSAVQVVHAEGRWEPAGAAIMNIDH